MSIACPASNSKDLERYWRWFSNTSTDLQCTQLKVSDELPMWTAFVQSCHILPKGPTYISFTFQQNKFDLETLGVGQFCRKSKIYSPFYPITDSKCAPVSFVHIQLHKWSLRSVMVLIIFCTLYLFQYLPLLFFSLHLCDLLGLPIHLINEVSGSHY